MKKQNISGWKIMVSALLMVLLSMSLASAEKKIFHGTGEYTMSDYETPAVAEQRALAYAKNNAAEQAGVYVENYTRMENMQVTEDRVNLFVNSAMVIIDAKSEKRALPSGDIHLVSSIRVEIDTAQMDRIINNRNIQNIEKMYQQNKKESVIEEEETNVLKKKIFEMKQKNMLVDDLKIRIKEKENEFLCNRKIEEVLGLWGSKRYKESLNVAEDAVRINPKSYKAYAARGGSYGYLGEYDNTIKDTSRALALNDKHAWSYNARGYAYYKKGNIEEAINNYKIAISIDPKYEMPYLNWGNVYFDMKEYFMAKDVYNKILGINPKSGNAYYNLGITCYYLGTFDEAIDDMNKALSLKGEIVNDKEVHRVIGIIYCEKGDYDNAMREYNTILSIDNKYAMAYVDIGNLYYQQKKYEKAKSAYEEAIKLDPKNELALKNLQMINNERKNK